MSKQRSYNDNEMPSDANEKSSSAVKLPQERPKKTRGRERQQRPEELVVQEGAFGELVLVRV